jgi:YbbR domain-containing protein
MIRFLRSLFFEDLALKLFSLGLAVLTWVTVWIAIQREVSPVTALAGMKEKTFVNLPVSVLSSAGDVHSFRVEPKEVQVTVQGDSRVLSAVKSKDIRVLVDLTGIEPIVGLRKRIEVSTPPGVTHVRVIPEEVLVISPSRP